MWCGPPPSRGRQGPQGTDCVPGRKRGKLNADIMVDVPTVGVYACAVVCIRVMLSKQCDAFGREEKNKFLFLTSFITRLRKHNQSRHLYSRSKSVGNSGLQYQTHMSLKAMLFVCITLRLHPKMKLHSSLIPDYISLMLLCT